MTTLRDAIARRLFEHDHHESHSGMFVPFGEQPPIVRRTYEARADVMLEAQRAFFDGHPERVSELFGPGFKLVSRDPTEAQVEAIRHAMSREKFVSHMRAIDCWTEGWLAAAPTMPSELVLVGEKS